MFSVYRCWAAVQLSPPMVGHNYTLDAVVHSQLGVLLGQDALDDDGEAGDRPQPGDILPADGGVQGIGRYPVLLWTSCLLLIVEEKQ